MLCRRRCILFEPSLFESMRLTTSTGCDVAMRPHEWRCATLVSTDGLWGQSLGPIVTKYIRCRAVFGSELRNHHVSLQNRFEGYGIRLGVQEVERDTALPNRLWAEYSRHGRGVRSDVLRYARGTSKMCLSTLIVVDVEANVLGRRSCRLPQRGPSQIGLGQAGDRDRWQITTYVCFACTAPARLLRGWGSRCPKGLPREGLRRTTAGIRRRRASFPRKRTGRGRG